MLEVIFLGTSASAPSIRRGLSAQVVIYNEHRFLVDCGEGTQRQILRSGLGFRRLNKILLTHGHLDHILGLGGLISTFVRWEASEMIDIWGSRRTLQRVHNLLFGVVLPSENALMKLSLNEVTQGILFEDEGFRVSAFPVEHRGAGSYGYCFEQKERRPFLNDRANELGVPRGPERRDLINGQAITLEDGRVIQPEDVLDDPVPGVKLCITGDVSRPTNRFKEAIHGADALICEATYLDVEADLAKAHGHLTARQAGELAAELDVKSLLLTHVSRRYRERDIIAEAENYFPGAIVVRDFDRVHVRRDEALEFIRP